MPGHLRRTKIIATLGPSSNSKKNIEKLIERGVDCFRLNFSHGSKDFHRECIQKIREISRSKGRYCGILADLQGPKIRVGEIQDGKVLLKHGEPIILTPEKVLGNAEKVSISYKELALDVRKGNQFLLDDGLLTFEVEQVDLSTQEIHCRVIYGGDLKSRKGINLPGVNLSARSLTAQDLENAFLSIEEWVDYIALSFVRKPEDIVFLQELIANHGKRIPIIAKIERNEALENMEAILQKADGLMIARGDLGVEMRLEKVPLIQKKLIRECNLSTKLVITATQMLESMIQNPMPTRAEVSDIANAILDGSDAIMLSGETAVGKYPFEVVDQMVQIALEIEGSSTSSTTLYTRAFFYDEREYPERTAKIGETMALSACRISKNLKVKAIFAYTHTGDSIRLLSKFHPVCPIIAICSTPKLAQEMQLVWGVIPFVRPSHQEPKAKSTPNSDLKENQEEWKSFLSSVFETNELTSDDLIVTTGNKKLSSKDKINSVKILHFSQFVL